MEIKDLIKSLHEDLKAKYEQQEAEVKKFGEATQETKSTIEKLNEAIDGYKERLDQLELKLNRPGFGGESGGKQVDPDKKAAFVKFLKKGRAGMTPDERKALVEDADGEILVSEDLEAEIYRELPKITVMRQLATVRTTNSNRVRRRSLNEVTVGWGKIETSNKKLSDFESSLKPDQEYAYIENLYGLTKIGEDELMDADNSLEAHVSDSFSRAKAEAEDTAFVAGKGHSQEQPEGILNAPGIQRKTGAISKAVAVDDILAVVYDLPEQYARNGSFLMNRATELKIRQLRDENGQYLWQPSVQAGRPNTFLGHPIYQQGDVPDVDAGGKVVVFGDFKAGYVIYDRMGMTITRLNELYQEDGLIGFKFKSRVGGAVVRSNAFRILETPVVEG
ncbi:phage major capsid protein [Desmospora sp. 8437]|nr:phage major capsid protein [Desmospora sp. 8437]